ncbi:MAG: Ig-like domain-containing protein, partial [Bacteroidota bacterium]
MLITPLTNDFNTAGGLELSSIPLVNHGTAVILNGTEILFTPEPGYSGVGHLNYTVCDAGGNCRAGSVSIGIGSTVPDCSSLKLHVKKDELHTFPLSFICDTFRTTTHGTLQIENGHVLHYKPEPGFTGSDECVLYFKKNGFFCSRSVAFRVIDPGTPNVMAMDDRVFTPVGMPVTFNVRQNDIGNLLVRGWVVPADFPGTLTNKTSAGQVTFTPKAGFSGTATFQYRIGSPSASSLETATVSIVVDNLAPSGRYIHKLTSPAGIPLVINYDIPFDDFSFGVASGASHGQVQYFPGKSTQIVSGESVTGNNLIIYTPDYGYLGADKFSLLYCAPNGQCQVARLEVELTPTASSSACFNECVWPGDINNDGAINSRDLLPLGLLTGRAGAPRSTAGTEWTGYASAPWPSNLVETGFNHKHADADGNGEISAPDADFLRVDGQKSRNLMPPVIPEIKGLPFYMKMLTPSPQLGKPMQIE